MDGESRKRETEAGTTLMTVERKKYVVEMKKDHQVQGKALDTRG